MCVFIADGVVANTLADIGAPKKENSCLLYNTFCASITFLL